MEHETQKLEFIGVTLNNKINDEGVVIQVDVSSVGLRRKCPYCEGETCYHHCDESQAGGFEIDTCLETDDEYDSRYRFNTAISAIEYVIMQHRMRGMDVESDEYQMGILDAVVNLEELMPLD
jgi:hypothetical protein